MCTEKVQKNAYHLYNRDEPEEEKKTPPKRSRVKDEENKFVMKKCIWKRANVVFSWIFKSENTILVKPVVFFWRRFIVFRQRIFIVVLTEPSPMIRPILSTVELFREKHLSNEFHCEKSRPIFRHFSLGFKTIFISNNKKSHKLELSQSLFKMHCFVLKSRFTVIFFCCLFSFKGVFTLALVKKK